MSRQGQKQQYRYTYRESRTENLDPKDEELLKDFMRNMRGKEFEFMQQAFRSMGKVDPRFKKLEMILGFAELASKFYE